MKFMSVRAKRSNYVLRMAIMAAGLMGIFLGFVCNECVGQLPELKGVRDLFEQGNAAQDDARSSSKGTGEADSKVPKKVVEKKVGKPIDLQHDLQAAQQLATLEGRPLLAVFGADWCTWCRKLELELQDEGAESILKSWIVVRIDADEAVELSQSMNVSALPALRILDFQLNQVAGREGYLPIDELEAWLDEKYALANPEVQKVLFGTGPISTEDLQQLVGLLADRSPKIRSAAVQRIVPNRRQSAEAIVEIVQSGKLAQKLAALQILSSWNAPVEMIDPWVPETISEERSDKLRVWLTELLAQEPDPNNSPDSSTDGTTDSSEDSTTQGPPIDPNQARELIAQFLRDPVGGSSVTNSDSVGQLGPVLREMLESDALSDSDRQRLRELMYHALASRNTRLSESSLLVGLSSLNADTHRKAAEKLLSKLNKSDLQLIDELSRDLDPLVREMSIPTLDKIKVLSEKDRLTRLLKDKSPSVRTAVLRALSVNANTEAVDVLVEYTSSESDEDLLVFAAKTLGKMKLKKTREAMSSLLKHSSWRIRAAALDAIGESLEKRSSIQSSGSSALSEEIVDAVIASLDDSDTFVVSRAQTLLPKVIDGKNAEKIVGSLVRNPKSLSFWLEGNFHQQSSDSKDFSKAATKFLSSSEENERLGAVRLLAKVAPIELKSAVPTLLDQSDAIKIASLEGTAAMFARLRDRAIQPQSGYQGSSGTSSNLLPKLQFKPWFEIPESLRSIPKESKKSSAASVAESPRVAVVESSKPDDLDQVVDSFFSSPGEKAKAVEDTSVSIKPVVEAALDVSNESSIESKESPNNSLDSLDDFFGSSKLSEEGPIARATPKLSDGPALESEADTLSIKKSLPAVEDLFGSVEGMATSDDDSAGSFGSGRNRGASSKDPSLGLPSYWLENYRKNGPKVFKSMPRQYDLEPLTDKEIKALDAIREKVNQQLEDESNPSTQDLRSWLEVASLSLGDSSKSESLRKKFDIESIVNSTDDKDKSAFQQLELALSWMPGDQRLSVLLRARFDWPKLSERHKSLLHQATVINHQPIADWLLQEATKHENSDATLAEMQVVLTRSLFGQLIDVHSRQYFGSDWEDQIQSSNPTGYKLSIDWMEQSFHAAQSANIRAMLLGTLSFVDFELAKQTAVGYLSQTTEYEGSLTEVALVLSLSDKPEFSADRAAQWLGHPVNAVREASIRRLTSTASEFSGAMESKVKVKVKSYYFRDDHNVQPGFTFVRREIPVELVRTYASDESSKFQYKYRVLLFLLDPQVSWDSCIELGDTLTSQALLTAAIVKSNRTGEDVDQFFNAAHKDFLEFQAGFDEPEVSAQLRMYFWSLSKMRGARYVALRNELRKKFPALSE